MHAPPRPRFLAATVPAAALALLVAATGTARADDVIPADKAKEHVGEEGTFEMTVRFSRNVESSEVYFLNSEEDYHDPKNLAVVIEYEHAAPFKEAGIADPAEHYRGKTIRVTGKVIEERNQTRIRVTSPKQIRVVEKEGDEKKTASDGADSDRSEDGRWSMMGGRSAMVDGQSSDIDH